MSIPKRTVGIDAGATLCKVVYLEETLRTELYSSRDLDRVRSDVGDLNPRLIAVTGGGAQSFPSEIRGIPTRKVQEFEAWTAGAPVLASLDGLELPARYLLVSLGTGTSVLAVDGEGGRRIGGTALGGGTLLGLSELLLGVESFEKLAELAARGDRRPVDLLVGDIYPSGGIPLPPDLTASNFAKLESRRPEDLARAIMGLVGENVALICGGLARETDADGILYCGSTLCGNPALEEILAQVNGMMGKQSHFLEKGAYCGAVGAAVLGGS
jgi:type II pantothenate kinase